MEREALGGGGGIAHLLRVARAPASAMRVRRVWVPVAAEVVEGEEVRGIDAQVVWVLGMGASPGVCTDAEVGGFRPSCW